MEHLRLHPVILEEFVAKNEWKEQSGMRTILYGGANYWRTAKRSYIGIQRYLRSVEIFFPLIVVSYLYNMKLSQNLSQQQLPNSNKRLLNAQLTGRKSDIDVDKVNRLIELSKNFNI